MLTLFFEFGPGVKQNTLKIEQYIKNYKLLLTKERQNYDQFKRTRKARNNTKHTKIEAMEL